MRGIVAWAGFGVVIGGIGLLSLSFAHAQTFTWGGTTATTDYNFGTNWSNPPPGAPPVTAGQAAVFDATGDSTVSVTAGPIAPDSWTFSANAQSFTISGAAVNFSLAGPTGGIIDTASGQTISIANNIGQGVAGVQVQLLGASTLILSGTNTYSGGTLVSGGGALRVTNNSSVGTGAVTLDDGLFQTGASFTLNNNFRINASAFGSAIDANGYALTISGSITDGNGAGQLTVYSSFGSGSLILTGANTYSGGTTICFCATLQLGDATHTGSIIGAVTNEGTLDIVNANTAGITSITNDGGQIRIFSKNTFASPLITNEHGGAIFFVDQSNAGGATIINRSGAATIFEDSSSAMTANITTNSSSALYFTGFATAGDATITTRSGGSTIFQSNATGGNAQFITNGTGVVDFSGSLGPDNVGRITAGSIAGSGTYYIGGGNTLVVGSNNLSTSVSGVIDDGCGCLPGNLEKVGSGTLTLSGTNTYTGTTTVKGGFLDVEGSIADSSLTTVTSGGALTGVGTVGNTMVASAGIFLPGNGTPGTSTHVAGNLAFQSGALYLVTLNSTDANFADVTGTAVLGGTVGAAFVSGSTLSKNKSYKILIAAGGVSGGFGGVAVTGGPGGLVPTLSYDGANAYLNFALDFNATPGLNGNQRNVGNALTNFFNVNGSIPVMFGLLTPAGLTQVSGETATGAQPATFQAMSLFLGLMTDPFVAGRNNGNGASGAQPYAEVARPAHDAFARIPTKADAARNDLLDPRWSIWGAAYGGGADIDGAATPGSNSASVRAFGFVGGADYRISPSTLAGFALGGGGTSFSVNGFGTGRSDLFQAGAFVRHTIGSSYVTGALAYGSQQITTDRTVTVAGFDKLHAQFNAHALSGRIEGGTRFATPWMGITPYAAGQFTTLSLPAYAEQVLAGAGTFALNYAAKDVTASRSEIGVRADRSFALESAVLTLRSRFAWAHDFNTDRNATAVFQSLPGASFVVNGAAQARDSALTTASAEMTWLNGWSAAATFEGEFSPISRSYAGKGVVRYAW